MLYKEKVSISDGKWQERQEVQESKGKSKICHKETHWISWRETNLINNQECDVIVILGCAASELVIE